MTAWKRISLVSVHRQKSLEYSRHYRGTLIPPSSCFHVERPPLEQHCWFPLPPSLTHLSLEEESTTRLVGDSHWYVPIPSLGKTIQRKTCNCWRFAFFASASDQLTLLGQHIVPALQMKSFLHLVSPVSPLGGGGLWVVASKVSASTFS